MSGQLGNTAESDCLKLLFQNTNWALLGDATGVRGSTVAGSLFVTLHTASPGAGGSQTTSEMAYTGNGGRVAVARSSITGWDITGSSPTASANHSATTFGACTAGSETETDCSIGRDSSGAGELLWFGPLTASLGVSNGITPSFAAGALIAQLQ